MCTTNINTATNTTVTVSSTNTTPTDSLLECSTLRSRKVHFFFTVLNDVRFYISYTRKFTALESIMIKSKKNLSSSIMRIISLTHILSFPLLLRETFLSCEFSCVSSVNEKFSTFYFRSDFLTFPSFSFLALSSIPLLRFPVQ